jgi:tRNA U34 5-carboxymethylaminomethyl modifying GTPase MnmE/TrmE
MDVESSAANLKKFKTRNKVDIIEISCATGEGLEELTHALRKRVIKNGGTPRLIKKTA